MSENINDVRIKLLWKEVNEIDKTSKSQPHECLLQIHEKIKQMLQLTDEEYFRNDLLKNHRPEISVYGWDETFLGHKHEFFRNISRRYSHAIEEMDKPDQKIFDAVKEYVNLEKTFLNGTNNAESFSLITRIVEINPELQDQALQFYKECNDSFHLLRVAEKNPEFKKDIVDFLRDHINYDAKNYLQLTEFVKISGDEKIKKKVIQTLRESEKTKQSYVLASTLASLSNDQDDISRAVSLIRQYVVSENSKNDPILYYSGILEYKLSPLPKGDAKNQIFKEIFHKSEDSLLSISEREGAHWTHMNKIVCLCVHNDPNIIPEALNLLKREIRLFPADYKKLGWMYCNVDWQSDTLFGALDRIVQKDPSRAKEAFEMGKDYNRALDLDEKFTCYANKSRYYHALGTFAKADESLKPEIISIIKENMAQDNKEDLPYGCNLESGQKVLQELTMPQINRGNGHTIG